MSPVERILSLLPSAKPNGSGWLACCPGHEDRSPSLSISEGDDGRALLKCFAGCSTESVVTALGLKPSDLFPDRNASRPRSTTSAKPKSATPPKGSRFPTAGAAVASLATKLGQPAGQWTYRDVSGKPVALVVRFNRPDGSKEFRPVSLHENGGWYITAPATPRPLYNLPEVATAETVYILEGEKAADAIRSLGLVAVTSMNGSQAPELSDWTPLLGKSIAILPDHDEPGRKYAEAVVEILHRLDSSARIKIVDLPGIPSKGDAVEWIESYGDAAAPETVRGELLRLVDDAEPIIAELIEAEDMAFDPFPVDVLPETVRSFVTAGAKSLGADPSFVALPILAMLGACIGNTRRLVIKRGWAEPPVVWSVIVGNSGACKSPALELALKPLKDRQREAFKAHFDALAGFESAKALHERSLDAWKKNRSSTEPPPEAPLEPIAERFISDDTTTEGLAGLLLNQPRGLLNARDELAGWLGSFDRYSAGKGGDVAKWLEMFGGRSITIDRKTGFPKTLFLPRAAVCLTGGIQAETLKRCLGQSNVDNGLAARLLFAYPPAMPRRWTDAEVPADVEAALAQTVDALLALQFDVNPSGDNEPKLVRLSPEAKRRFQEFVNEQGAEHVELSDDLSAAWSKLEGYAARLALIVHLAKAATGDADECEVDVASMEAGIILSRWFGREAKRIYAMLSESPDDSARRKLIDFIERKGGIVTAREVKQGNRRFESTADAEAALEQLVKAGFGHWELIPTTPRGGRVSRRFVLSTSTQPARNPERTQVS